MPHPHVILFDIDGTLLTVKSSFNRPLIREILDELEIDYPNMEKDPFSGRTDHDILSSFLVNHPKKESMYSLLKETYISRLHEKMNEDHVIRHEFVDEAISYFSEEGCILGLLTGNYPTAADKKLKTAKIEIAHQIGAFGEFVKERNQLPILAMNEFESKFGLKADPSKFIIIGDTPRDVECANYAGMKCAAITTGKFSSDELSVYNPTLVIDSLENSGSWFSKIMD